MLSVKAREAAAER